MSYRCYRGNKLPEGAKASEKAKEFGCDACEYMHDNELTTCTKFMGITGSNPNLEEDYKETFKCTELWLPILMVDNSRVTQSTTKAVEVMRESIKDNIGVINHNLKNTSEALANANVMSRLEQKIVEVTPQVQPAVVPVIPLVLPTEADIYGGLGPK